MSKSLLMINEPKDKQDASKRRLNQQLSSTGEVASQPKQSHSRLKQLTALPIWDLAFRPWFLASALMSVVSLGIWVLFLHGQFAGFATGGITPLVWHIHEMLFGFGATVAVAFLLTAAQTWTKKRSLNGGGLLALTLIWFMVRGLLWSPDNRLQVLAIVLQGLWWLVSITYLASMVIRARSQRNYQFIPLLSVMMLLNLGFLVADFVGQTQLALHLARSAILMFGLLVGIVGGRVIPFFTGRGAEAANVSATPWINKLLPVVTILAIAVFFIGDFVVLPFTPAALLITAGVLHLLRLLNWDSLATRTVPLLWSLHGSYLALGLGFVALGISYLTDSMRFADALHLITVGTIGGMILAMMARVSLGHTGRPLKPHASLNIAFALILLGAIVRFIFPLLQQPLWAWDLGAACWIVAFAIFIWHYTPILFKARQS